MAQEKFSYASSDKRSEDNSRQLRNELFKLLYKKTLDLGGASAEPETKKQLDDLRQEVEKSRGNDPEARDVASLLDDAIKNFREGRPNISQWPSIRSIVERIRRETSPFRDQDHRIETTRLSISHSSYKNLIEAVELVGTARVAYVVLSNNSQAPTILLAPQVHYDEGIADEVYTVAATTFRKYHITNYAIDAYSRNHAHITTAIRSMSPQKIYLELVYRELGVQTSVVQYPYAATHSAWTNLMKEIPHLGLEEKFNLSDIALVQHDASNNIRLQQWENIRLQIENTFLADTVLDDLVTGKHSRSVVVIGFSHEEAVGSIPISSILAAGGYNIIVLNSPAKDWSRKDIQTDNLILENLSKLVTTLCWKYEDPAQDNDIPLLADDTKIDEIICMLLEKKYPKTVTLIKNRGIKMSIFVEIVREAYFKARHKDPRKSP